MARERVDAGASAFGAEGAFVLCVGGVFLSVLGSAVAEGVGRVVE